MSAVRAIANIFHFVIYSFLLFLGVIFIASYADASWAIPLKKAVTTYISEGIFATKWLYLLWGIGFCVVFIFAILKFFAQEDPSDGVVSLKDEGGYVHISVDAIRDYIKKIALNQSEVLEARGKVVYHKEQALLGISLRIGISSKQSIAGVASILKEEIRKKLISVIGLSDENIDSIELHVENIDKRKLADDADEKLVARDKQRKEMTRIR